ncbi:MAG: hypothetical protein HY958_10825 [Bacteroidia bacterium]|nr:hypothetical protein [Bacteroidia bacterium]
MTKLNNIEKKNPFKVPGNYFKELPSRIQDKITEQKLSSSKNRITHFLMRPQVAAAITIVIVSLVIFRIFHHHNQGIAEQQLTENIIIENYIDENTIVNVMAEDTLPYVVPVIEKDSTISEEELDYAANNIDYETLIAEL